MASEEQPTAGADASADPFGDDAFDVEEVAEEAPTTDTSGGMGMDGGMDDMGFDASPPAPADADMGMMGGGGMDMGGMDMGGGMDDMFGGAVPVASPAAPVETKKSFAPVLQVEDNGAVECVPLPRSLTSLLLSTHRTRIGFGLLPRVALTIVGGRVEQEVRGGAPREARDAPRRVKRREDEADGGCQERARDVRCHPQGARPAPLCPHLPSSPRTSGRDGAAEGGCRKVSVDHEAQGRACLKLPIVLRGTAV